LFDQSGIYLFMVNTTSLQGQTKSAISNTMIKGQIFKLEDGKTCISTEEMLEW